MNKPTAKIILFDSYDMITTSSTYDGFLTISNLGDALSNTNSFTYMNNNLVLNDNETAGQQISNWFTSVFNNVNVTNTDEGTEFYNGTTKVRSKLYDAIQLFSDETVTDDDRSFYYGQWDYCIKSNGSALFRTYSNQNK